MIPPALVTCVIPVYNGEKYLSEAVESVLSQTYESVEIVVVDDGSTDATPSILADLADRITSLRQENAGPAAARNRGIAAARGEYVAFLDADDLWVAEKTARQVQHLEANKDCGASISLMQNFWVEELAEEAERMEGSSLAAPQPGPSTTLMVRRAVFDRVGLVNPEILHRDTMDWIVRARAAGVRFAELDEVLVRRRLHENNLSRTRGAEDADDLFAIIQSRIAKGGATGRS